MAKVYAHTPIKQLVADFLLHLNQNKNPDNRPEDLDSQFSALIIAPIDGTKSFRQILPVFLKKLSKKFKTALKAEGVSSKATWTWDENLVMVLESLEEFLHLRWKVRFFADEQRESAEIDDFKTPLFSLGISEDLFVSLELLTLPQENNFDLNAAGEEKVVVDNDEDDNAELVVEEINREKTEEDKEMERIKKEEYDKKMEEEFQTGKEEVEKNLHLMQQLLKVGLFNNLIEIGENLLEEMRKFKSNTREHMIYVAGKTIEVSILLASVHLANGRVEDAKSMLTALVPVAKRGPVDTYVNLMVLLGDCEFELDDLEEAMKAYSQALSVKKKFSPEEKMTINAKRAKTAIKFELEDGVGYVNMTGDEGFKYMKYVQENTKPGEKLYSYAAQSVADVMFRKGQIGTAAHVCLVALVADSGDEALQKQFVEFMQAHDQLVEAMLDMIANIDNPDAARRKKSKEEEDKEKEKPEVPLTPEQMKKAISTASSLNFLGSILREHSAMPQAEDFFRKACSMTQYRAAEYILSFLCLLEDTRRFELYITTAMNYFAKCPQDGISVKIPKDVFEKSSKLIAAIEKLEEDDELKHMISKDAEGNLIYTLKNEMFHEWHSKAEKVIEANTSRFTFDFTRMESALKQHVTKAELIPVAIAAPEEPEKEPAAPVEEAATFSLLALNGKKAPLAEFLEALLESEARSSIDLEVQDLRMLGIYFNCIKVFLQVIPLPGTNRARTQGKDVIPELLRLVSLIEPIRAAAKDLSRGPVRNEEGYYSLICKTMPNVIKQREEVLENLKESNAYKSFSIEQQENRQILPKSEGFSKAYEDTFENIYVLGDKNILPLSWQLLHKGSDASKVTQFLPVLITGSKIWHFRDESDFHTKFSLNEAAQFIKRHFIKTQERQEDLTLKKAPFARTPEELDAFKLEKPKVIFNFGELDCREQMTQGLQRGKYKSPEEASTIIVDVYSKLLEKMAKKFGLIIYVHPVVPLASNTKDLVAVFNQVLEKKMRDLEKKSSDVKFLDFLPALVEDGGVKKELEANGSLLPSYLTLFKDQLS